LMDLADVAWLVRITADHIERVATIEHGRRRYVEGAQACCSSFLGGATPVRRRSWTRRAGHIERQLMIT
jgi:hypothetical protein